MKHSNTTKLTTNKQQNNRPTQPTNKQTNERTNERTHKKHANRRTHKQTHKQTDKETDTAKRTDTDKQTHKQTKTNKQTKTQASKPASKQASKPASQQTSMQTCKRASKQARKTTHQHARRATQDQTVGSGKAACREGDPSCEVMPASALSKHQIATKGGHRCQACNRLRMRLARLGSQHSLSTVASWSEATKRQFYQENAGVELTTADLEGKVQSTVSRATRKRAAGSSKRMSRLPLAISMEAGCLGAC